MMLKGFTALSASLFSGLLFAATQAPCPEIQDLNSLPGFEMVFPIIPGNMYTNLKAVTLEIGEEWAIFVGPIRAKNRDSVSDLANLIISNTDAVGEPEQTQEGDICVYDTGMHGVHVTAMHTGNVSDFIKKFKK